MTGLCLTNTASKAMHEESSMNLETENMLQRESLGSLYLAFRQNIIKLY
jgi:hypothetical protein